MQIKDGLEIERRFLLANAPDLSGQPDSPYRIEQVYLKKPDAAPRETHRLRKTSGEKIAYYYTIKSPGAGGARNERESEIEEAEFLQLLEFRDRNRRTIEKTRHVIPFQGHKMELDIFEGDLAGLVILEVELTSYDAALELPDWASGATEITHEAWFSNFNLSHADLAEIRTRAQAALG